MGNPVGWLFLLLYIFIAFRLFISSIRALIGYFRNERRRYEIIPGTIVDFESRYSLRKGRRRLRFYPVFEYSWKGKTRRGLARRVGARLEPGLEPVPATELNIGDAVQVRIFPKKPSDARIEESFYFWKSRMWVNIPGAIVSGIILSYGLCTAVTGLMSIF